MVIASCLLEKDPPRLAQGMAEKFMDRVPFSRWASRTGHFAGLPEHAARLLEDDRLLMVFPEGRARHGRSSTASATRWSTSAPGSCASR